MKKNQENIVQLWKDLGVGKGVFEFSCGGDSMDTTDLKFYDKDDKEMDVKKVEVLHDYIDNDIYNEVEFYEVSDGHYIGEAGLVNITLNDDEDDLVFEKHSTTEWSESVNNIVVVTLTKEEIDLVEKYVGSMDGDDSGCVMSYKGEFVMTDEMEKMFDTIKDKIVEGLEDHDFDYSPYDDNGDDGGYYTFEFNKMLEVGVEFTLWKNTYVTREGENE